MNTEWKKVLLEWATCTKFLNRKYFNLNHTDIEGFFNEFRSRISTIDSNVKTIRDFVEKYYPDFQVEWIEDGNHLNENDYIFLYTLFLHYSCLRCPDAEIRDLSKQLTDDTQNLIVDFFRSIIDKNLFDKDSLQAAISLTVLPSESLTTSPKSSSKKSTPPTPKTKLLNDWLTENRQLKALLETERFEKSDLENQLQQRDEEIVKINNQHKKCIDDINKLKNQLLNQDTENVSPNKNSNDEQIKRRLRKDIADREGIITQLSTDINVIKDEYDAVNEKLRFNEEQNNFLDKKVDELNATLELVRRELDERDEKIRELQYIKDDLQRFINAGRSTADSSNECLDSSLNISGINRSDSSTGEVAESLGCSVIDIQLKEQQQLNSELRQQLFELEASSSNEISNLSATLNSIKKQLSDTTEKAEEELQKLRKIIELTEERLRETEKDVNNGVDKIQNLHFTIDSISKENSCLRDEIEILTAESNIFQTELNSTNQSYMKLNIDYEKLQVLLSGKMESEAGVQQKSNELESAHEKLLQQNNDLMKQKEELLFNLKSSEELSMQLQKEVELKLKTIEEMKQSKDEKEKMFEDKLRQQSEMYQDEKLNNEIEMKVLNEKLDKTLHDLDHVNINCGKLRDYNKLLTNQIHKIQSERETDEKDAAKAIKNVEEANVMLMCSLRDVQEALSASKAENSSLNEKNQDMVANLGILHENVNKLKFLTDELTEKIKVFELEKNQLQASLNDIQNENGKYEDELKNSKKLSKNARKKLSEELEQHVQEKRQLIEELMELKESHAVSQNIVSTQHQTIIDVQVDNEKLVNENDRLLTEIEKLRNKIIKLSNITNITYPHNECNKLQTLMERADELKKEYETNIVDVKRSHTNVLEEAQHLKAEMIIVNEKLQSISDELCLHEEGAIKLEQVELKLLESEKTHEATAHVNPGEIEVYKKTVEGLIKERDQHINDLEKDVCKIKNKFNVVLEEYAKLLAKNSELIKKIDDLNTRYSRFELDYANNIISLENENSHLIYMINEANKSLLLFKTENDSLKVTSEIAQNKAESSKVENESIRLVRDAYAEQLRNTKKNENELYEVLINLKRDCEKCADMFDEIKVYSVKEIHEIHTKLNEAQNILQLTLANSNDELMRVKAELADMGKKLETSEQTIEKQENTILTMQSNTETKENVQIQEIDLMRQQLSVSQDEAARLRNTVERVSNECAELKLLLFKKTETEATLTAEITEQIEIQKHVQMEMETLIEKNNQLYEELAIAKAKYLALDVEVQAVKQVEMQLQEKESILGKVEMEKETFKEQIQQLENDKSEMKVKSDQLMQNLDKLTIDLGNAKKINQDLQDNNDKLHDRIDDLGKEFTKLEVDSGKQLKMIENENAKLKATIDETIQHLAQLKSEKVSLSDAVLQLQSEANEYKEENHKISKSASQMALKVDSLESERTVLRKEIDKIQQECDKYQTIGEDLKRKWDSLQVEIVYNQQRSAQLESQLKESTEEKNNLLQLKTKEYDSLCSKEKELSQAVAILQAKLIKHRETSSSQQKEWDEERERLKAAINDQESIDERIKQNRNELEGKLEKMKAKMKTLYNEEINKVKNKHEQEIFEFKAKVHKQDIKIKEYEQHVEKMAKQIFQLNDSHLELKKENELMKSKIRCMEDNKHLSMRTTSTAMSIGSNLKMEDEESELFNNDYLEELKSGSGGCIRPSISLSELKFRNSLVPSHLRSSYLLQYDDKGYTEEDVKQIDFDESVSSNQSEIRRGTLYQKPGPPTPSKNAGRLSLGGASVCSGGACGGNDLPKDVLKEQNGNNRPAGKKQAPGAFLSMFSTKTKDETMNQRKCISLISTPHRRVTDNLSANHQNLLNEVQLTNPINANEMIDIENVFENAKADHAIDEPNAVPDLFPQKLSMFLPIEFHPLERKISPRKHRDSRERRYSTVNRRRMTVNPIKIGNRIREANRAKAKQQRNKIFFNAWRLNLSQTSSNESNSECNLSASPPNVHLTQQTVCFDDDNACGKEQFEDVAQKKDSQMPFSCSSNNSNNNGETNEYDACVNSNLLYDVTLLSSSAAIKCHSKTMYSNPVIFNRRIPYRNTIVGSIESDTPVSLSRQPSQRSIHEYSQKIKVSDINFICIWNSLDRTLQAGVVFFFICFVVNFCYLVSNHLKL